MVQYMDEWVAPLIIHLDRIVHEINHPAIGELATLMGLSGPYQAIFCIFCGDIPWNLALKTSALYMVATSNESVPEMALGLRKRPYL